MLTFAETFFMTNPEKIYSKKIVQFNQELKTVKSQLFGSAMMRLGVFLIALFLVYWFWGNLQAVLLSAFGGLALFLFLVSRHADLVTKRDRLLTLIDINQTELEVLKRNFQHLPDGEKYKNSMHEFSMDIDLFGKGSFFQYLNRTALLGGEQKLVELLLSNNTQNIKTRQEAIKDLADKTDFRQEFTALSLLSSHKKEKPQEKLSALKSHSPFTPKFAILLAYGFSLISILVIAGYSMDLISVKWLILWMITGLGITGIYLKRVNAFAEKIEDMDKVFSQYYKLLQLLENTKFDSVFFQENQNKLKVSSAKKASGIVKDFSKILSAFDQRDNMLFGFLANAFLLWDLHQAARFEKWIKAHIDKAGEWFEIIEITDAYNSLGNFAFNHPTYVFPEITGSQTVFDTVGAVHPLIPEKEAVRNDFKIDKEEFFIITGANMAGKSTFLRTVSLQIVMSNTGLPVCATSCSYSPIKLITSMRTSDSLAEESSYFYAELSRLKFVIDHLEKDEYFIVLDEILKGTNSKDKAIGSRRFLEKLVKSKSTGIIATHDLSLCEVADNLPSVSNYYFDAQIIDDELYFDYTFKEGICQNMNASFLLEKMGIV